MRLTYFWQYSIFSRELDKFLRPRRGFYWRGGLNREFTVYGERSAFLPRWLAVSLASILQCNYTFFSVPGPSAETFLTISVSKFPRRSSQYFWVPMHRLCTYRESEKLQAADKTCIIFYTKSIRISNTYTLLNMLRSPQNPVLNFHNFLSSGELLTTLLCVQQMWRNTNSTMFFWNKVENYLQHLHNCLFLRNWKWDHFS